MKHEILRDFSKNFEITGFLPKDVVNFFNIHGHQKTARHSSLVAQEAKKIALLSNEDPEAAFKAGWLHDISAIFPNEERITIAKALNVIPLEEEKVFPLIIHQRISEVMAADIFGITNIGILSAVGCHTTLKKDATKLDKVLFVADKIQWDQEGKPPYIEALLNSLEISLDMAALSYLEYMWNRKDQLVVIHPWLKDAYKQLSQKGKSDA